MLITDNYNSVANGHLTSGDIQSQLQQQMDEIVEFRRVVLGSEVCRSSREDDAGLAIQVTWVPMFR